MANIDKEFLGLALENDENQSIMNLDHGKIKCIKNDVLQKLQLPREKLKQIHSSLKNYRYVDEISDLHYGSYIRWIKLIDPENIKMATGGFLCDIKILDDGVHLMCRGYANRLVQIKMNECHIFQKLNDEEQIILSVMDHLRGTKIQLLEKAEAKQG
jgi:hypothetical protein